MYSVEGRCFSAYSDSKIHSLATGCIKKKQGLSESKISLDVRKKKLIQKKSELSGVFLPARELLFFFGFVGEFLKREAICFTSTQYENALMEPLSASSLECTAKAVAIGTVTVSQGYIYYEKEQRIPTFDKRTTF